MTNLSIKKLRNFEDLENLQKDLKQLRERKKKTLHHDMSRNGLL